MKEIGSKVRDEGGLDGRMLDQSKSRLSGYPIFLNYHNKKTPNKFSERVPYESS